MSTFVQFLNMPCKAKGAGYPPQDVDGAFNVPE